MPLDAWITLGLLLGLFAMLIATGLPPWVIFLGTLTIAITLQLAPQNELLLGFSNSGVLTVGALFIVAAGIKSRSVEAKLFEVAEAPTPAGLDAFDRRILDIQ